MSSEPELELTGALPRARANWFLSAIRIALFTCAALSSTIGFLICRLTASSRSRAYAICIWWTRVWCRAAVRVMGINVDTVGPLPAPGSFIAPNHLGYADILVLGSVTPSLFAAKAEIESWPIVGALYRTTEHVGVSRRAGKGIASALERVAERLCAGASVCVFLEGTSSGGDGVKKFHGALLQAAIDHGRPVVPVGLTWRVDVPNGLVAEDVAYWKDHTLVPHLWRMLGLRRISVQLHFGEAIVFGKDMDRKIAAEEVREKVIALRTEGALE